MLSRAVDKISDGQLSVVLGLQWGDEGKGKVVDVLASSHQVIARFQGGPNAGHSLKFDGRQYVLHTIPSGIFRKDTINIIGNGVVVDPISFRQEMEGIEAAMPDSKLSLYIDPQAHLITPGHRALDAAQEEAKGGEKIGSTLKGIGPTYTDKTSRLGLRVGDTLLPDFAARYAHLKEHHRRQLQSFGKELPTDQEQAFLEGIQKLKQYRIFPAYQLVNSMLDKGIPVLAEGAQGTMLDLNFGSYPFVTSSSTICAGACTGLGVAPSRVGKVYGIFKAYCTRVGSGPFPTELHDRTGEQLRHQGHEFGATTGRPRRCGWLDLVALKYAVLLNGVTDLIMTKADVLTGFETIRVATHYEVNGEKVDQIPYAITEDVQPMYIDLPGWNEDLTQVTQYSQIPVNLKNYVDFVERAVGVPITIVSVGPDRVQTIIRGA